MCGIIGIARREPEAVRRAARRMSYRGPDAQGAHSDDRVSLAHNRLAIIDLDPRSNQPLWDEKREVCIVYNGEIYNYRELRSSLEVDYRFSTESDTEVILYGYMKYGPTFVRRLKGMFAYAIYDSRRNEIFIARDHAGIKPLYYAQDPEFAFSSEMQPLRALIEEGRGTLEMDREALSMYWAFGYIPAPHTAYVDIKVFPRSSFAVYELQNRTLTITPYVPDTMSITDESSLFALIEKKVAAHLIADVPVGLFFSGGTDSTVIAAALKRLNHPLKAFSIRVAGRDKDERYFRAISDTLSLDTQIYDFGPTEFEHIYEDVVGHLDVPIADNSIFPSYFVAKKAREEVTVVLSGEGGDEYFFGYQRHLVLRRMRKPSDPMLTLSDRAALATPRFKGKNRLLSDMHTRMHEPISYYLREMSPARDFLTGGMLTAAKSHLAGVISDALYLDRDMYLENMLLRKADMSTMLASLEGRVPLLDADVVASARAFEKTFLEGDMLKPVLKRMLGRDLPHELVHRPKSGFGITPAIFFSGSKQFRDDLRDAIRFMTKENVPAPSFPDVETLMRRYPDAAYAAVALFKVLNR